MAEHDPTVRWREVRDNAQKFLDWIAGGDKFFTITNGGRVDETEALRAQHEAIVAKMDAMIAAWKARPAD